MGLKQVLGSFGEALSRAVHGGEEGLTAKRLAAEEARVRASGRNPDKNDACRTLQRELDRQLGL